MYLIIFKKNVYTDIPVNKVGGVLIKYPQNPKILIFGLLSDNLSVVLTICIVNNSSFYLPRLILNAIKLKIAKIGKLKKYVSRHFRHF